MIFPIPNFLAEIAAKDYASDLRKIAREALPLKDAIERGEASESDKESYRLMIAQIHDGAQIVFQCVETGEQYCVGDYVTIRRRMLSAIRAKELAEGYRRLISYLH